MVLGHLLIVRRARSRRSRTARPTTYHGPRIAGLRQRTRAGGSAAWVATAQIVAFA